MWFHGLVFSMHANSSGMQSDVIVLTTRHSEQSYDEMKDPGLGMIYIQKRLTFRVPYYVIF